MALIMSSSLCDVNFKSPNLLIGASLLSLTLAFVYRKQRISSKMPGPKGLPLVGNMFQVFGGKPFLTFTKWAKEFGGLYKLKLGTQEAIVINDITVAKEALVSKGRAFAGRPTFYSMNAIHENERKFVFAPSNDDILKLYRKTVLSDIRKRTHLLDGIIHTEMEKLEQALFAEDQSQVTLHLGPVLNRVAANVALGYVYGQNYALDNPIVSQWVKAVADYRELLHWFRPENFLPHSNLFLPTYDKKVLAFRESTRDLFLAGIQDARQRYKQGVQDADNTCVIDTILEMFESTKQPVAATDDDIIAILRDVIFGCSDGAYEPMTWATLFLAQNPDCQDKLYANICEVLGKEDGIGLGDKDKLPYVEATIREVFRFGEITTLGIPHRTLEDTKLGEHDIPKDTLVIVNVYALHRDEKHWQNPERFRPERFLDDSNGLLPLNDLSFLPFSIGNRSCPGQNLARNFLFLLFTHFFQKFKVAVPKGEEIPEDVNQGGAFNPDMKVFNLTVSRRC